jgi:uncharacterized protein DUF6529
MAADEGPVGPGRSGSGGASGPGGPAEPGGSGAARVGESAAARLGLALLLAVTAVLVVVGRVHQPNYSATIFGQSALGALALKSWLATVTLGCFLYGAFAAKVLLVHSRRLPGWALPVAGGALVTAVVVLWYSAALWYFNGFQLPHW